MKPLEKIYSDLDFQGGELYLAADNPHQYNKDEWLEKGEWLSAAKRAKADAVFFIDNNPIAVFATCNDDNQLEKLRTFNRIWSLARPRLLFLAAPGEITVYDLAQKPFDFSDKSKNNKLKHLAVLHDIEKAAHKLQDFHRDNIESGKIFEKGIFGDLKNRADKSLIRDLKIVRRELIQAGLSGEKVKYAHALIGRSIFIRYLEDRKILTEDYFRKVARKKAGWTDILKLETPVLDFSGVKPIYPRILKNKDFTYALFRTLGRDFNGDMFPHVDKEEKSIEQFHLDIVCDLFYGNAGIQKKLFFYSYCFDIVPLDLISSIYEEFYHPSVNDNEKKNRARQDGAFYTPSSLVEFVLSRTLTPEELNKNPRVLDPACGSGIFLVEAFRRMVRYRQCKKKKPLTFDELKTILQAQISGIEVNEEAARITAFSLYLSMLHYLDPPCINEQIKQGNSLPNLITTESRSKNHYHCIWAGNAFDTETIHDNAFLRDRFGKESADIVVGNPPWGAPGNKADEIAKIREQVMIDWCKKNDKPIGDKEPSQAFLWRTLDFLKDGGKAGMLVSAGILFKHSSTTQAFREQWMNSVCLKEIFNFAHVRRFFFKGANSPFIAICFAKSRQNDFFVNYWSAKQVKILKETQVVCFSKYDVHILRKEGLKFSKLWKSLWFGRFSDYKFIEFLNQNLFFSAIINKKSSGRGYQTYTGYHDGNKMGVSKTLKNMNSRYDIINFIPAPKKVYNLGPIGSYNGNRLLINEGIFEKGNIKGCIIARLEKEPFSFYRSIYGVKLISDSSEEYIILLGILWSSLTRYYFFCTSATWGLWHHKLLFDELLQLPVVINKENPATNKIISIVDKLRNYHPQKLDVLHPDGVPEKEINENRRKWEAELDEAVFDLYDLNEEQRDLIRDCCEVTLPFFYKPFDSIGAMPAVYAPDVKKKSESKNNLVWIAAYVKIFARRWNAYLKENEEMRAEVHLGAHGNMLAIEFFPSDKEDAWNLKPKTESWGYILEQIGKVLPQPMGTSQILLDGIINVISNDGIIIIKRNEKRFWTRSLAREDAEATLCKAMQKSERNL